MKKLLAILLSVLMLCAMIPFATVAAAEGPTVQVSVTMDDDEVTELVSGDEFQVTVNLLNIPDPGLIGAQVEIVYDHDVFELVTYFDEDEEMWIPQIEVGSKYNASTNKYIVFGPIDEDTGVSQNCLVQYLRATAKETQVRYEEHYFTATFRVKDDAPAGNYELVADGYQGGNTVGYGLVSLGDQFSAENVTVAVNGGASEECEHANTSPLYTYGSDNGLHKVIVTCDDCGVAVDTYEEPCTGGTATCTECAICEKCGLNYGDTLPHEYFSDCDTVCMICGEETRPEAAHNVIHVEAKDATCTELGNIEYWYCDVCGMAWLDEDCTQNTNLMSVKLPMVDHEYFYACDPVCMNCYEITNPNAAHSLSHVEAKDATCFENGNVEYWTCEYCGGCWDNEAATGMPLNQMMVVVPMAHDELTHVEAKAPTCFENGNIEYWYCEACGMAWLDAEGTLNTNLMAVVLPMAHDELTHVEAVAPTCYENGNIEYWYCEACGMAWLDAEGTLNTNLMAVVLPMAHGEITHVAAKDATCTELGNIEYWYCEACGQAWLDEACTLNTNLMAVKLPMAEHTYDNIHDADCNVCGEIRDIVLSADEIILFGGNSVTEIKGGLAFKFDAAVSGIVIGEEYVADYTDAIVTIDGVEYKLVKMGAIMNNKGYAEQSLDNVDGKSILNVEANKVFGEYSYAVRIINIPEAHLDTEITARPYFIYENLGGEQITVYGADVATSYNAVLNG